MEGKGKEFEVKLKFLLSIQRTSILTHYIQNSRGSANENIYFFKISTIF